ncbi:MAG: hypothetical protein LUG44_08140, partial [Clostridiales bacterium]|nr:hypothetical protein [Clostridiales bacterium]
VPSLPVTYLTSLYTVAARRFRMGFPGGHGPPLQVLNEIGIIFRFYAVQMAIHIGNPDIRFASLTSMFSLFLLLTGNKKRVPKNAGTPTFFGTGEQGMNYSSSMAPMGH